MPNQQYSDNEDNNEEIVLHEWTGNLIQRTHCRDFFCLTYAREKPTNFVLGYINISSNMSKKIEIEFSN